MSVFGVVGRATVWSDGIPICNCGIHDVGVVVLCGNALFDAEVWLGCGDGVTLGCGNGVSLAAGASLV
ncbi:MAG: hypothetical protein RRY10_06280, partial [Christensenellaceae bacterium]